jgi:5-formyltetrahydrofolate cyclo-ligase
VHEAVGDDDHKQRSTLRQSLRARRAALSLAEVHAASADVCAALASLPVLTRARAVALYAAFRGEIDLEPLRAILHSRHIRVAYPRVIANQPPQQTFHEVFAGETLPPDKFSIPAPLPTAPPIDPQELDVILVPAIALSRDGQRLGWGFGHYDHALRQFSRALRIGVVHDFQLIAPFATHAGDEPVDLIQTPRERIVTRARAFAPEEVLS